LGLCQTHPKKALALLGVVVGDKPQWPPHKLRNASIQFSELTTHWRATISPTPRAAY
jgi:hypothetical protein